MLQGSSSLDTLITDIKSVIIISNFCQKDRTLTTCRDSCGARRSHNSCSVDTTRIALIPFHFIRLHAVTYSRAFGGSPPTIAPRHYSLVPVPGTVCTMRKPIKKAPLKKGALIPQAAGACLQQKLPVTPLSGGLLKSTLQPQA